MTIADLLMVAATTTALAEVAAEVIGDKRWLRCDRCRQQGAEGCRKGKLVR